MKWFNNLKIKSKLIVSALITVIFLAGVGGIGLYYTSVMSHKLADMYEGDLIPVKLLNETRTNMREVHGMILESTLANLDPNTEQQMSQRIKELSGETDQTLAEYAQGQLTAYETERLNQLQQAIQLYRAERQKALVISQTGGKQAAYAYFTQHANQPLADINRLLKELADYNATTSKQADEQGKQAAAAATTMVIALTVLAVVLSGGFSWFLARMIDRRLNSVIATFKNIASGDLTAQVVVTANDEIGHLGDTLNAMTGKLRDSFAQVAQSAEQVAASSEEITASADQSAQAANQISGSITDVAKGAEDQLAVADDTSAAVEQMSASIQQVAANAKTVADETDRATVKANEGNQSVEQAVTQMAHIEQTVTTSAEVVTKLGERSQEIGQIVDTIAGIAGQTNLLALNAAIEAARAGEQGRGFAVVAEEVRKLAEQSQEAAKQIATLIGEIQGDTGKAVVAMKDGTTEVKRGTEVVQASGQVFREIVALVTHIAGQMKEISAAIEQMALGGQTIVGSVKRIDELSKTALGATQTVSAATEEQSASMEEIASSSQALARLAQDLQQAVNKFQISR